MAKIELQNIAHSYNPQAVDKTYALNPFNMTWVDGGRYAILGPSGCGKTTMLNIMSGIVQPSEGKLLFDGVDVTTLSTSERNIAQVFQFPVIYGTMTVEQNLAFPLVCRNYEKSEIDAKVQQANSLSSEYSIFLFILIIFIGASLTLIPDNIIFSINSFAEPSRIGTSSLSISIIALSIPNPNNAPIKCSIVETFIPNSFSIVVFNEVFVTFMKFGYIKLLVFKSTLLKTIPKLGSAGLMHTLTFSPL